MAERVQAQGDPVERAGLLARAFAALLGDVILWDDAGRVVYASEGALRRLGVTPGPPDPDGRSAGDLVGRTCLEFPVEPTLRTALSAGVQTVLATGKPLARDLSAHLSFRSMPLAGEDGPPWAVVTWLRPVVSAARSTPATTPEPVVWEDADGLVAAFLDNFEMADFASSLFDAQGRVKLPPGSGAEVGGGLPPGMVTEDIANLDRAGTWLKRPPIDYSPTRFDEYWMPGGTLLQEWVRRGVREVSIRIPGTSKRIHCVVSLLQLGGGCGINDPDMQDQEATARPPPDIPWKPELQEGAR